MLLDTHCHLTDERYRDDLRLVLRRAAEGGVAGVVAVASNLEDARAVAGLVPGPDDGPRVWGTAGVHPHEAGRAPGDLRNRLTDTLDESGAVAIGECGLDFHYDFTPPDRQREVFDTQLEIAAERDLPVVVHCRSAEEEMARRVREAGRSGVRGVIHCFGGNLALLEAVLDAGWLVSFTGLVTFPSFDGSESVRRAPAGRYMLETDGPYLAPIPHRGRRNEPAYLARVRDRVAELRGISPSDVERETGEAARAFFRLPPMDGRR
jgi:TatD DNase family protein